MVVFTDEGASNARKEMLDICLSCYNEEDYEFMMEYLDFLQIPSTKSDALLEKLKGILKRREIDPQIGQLQYREK